MKAFFAKNYISGARTTIATEQDRLNYMFENNLTDAPNLEDLETEEKRELRRRQKKLRFELRSIISDIYDHHFWRHVWNNHFKHKERFKISRFFPHKKQMIESGNKIYWKREN